MTIGINSMQASNTLDFSALNSEGSQNKALSEQNTQKAVDPSSLLFASDKQKDVNFGQPDNSVQNSQDGGKAGDSQSKIMKLLTELLQALSDMLSGKDKKQDAGQEQNNGGGGGNQAPSNNGGLGTPPASGGGGGTPAAAGGGSGGGAPAAAGGGDSGGGAPAAAGGGGAPAAGGAPQSLASADGPSNNTGDAAKGSNPLESLLTELAAKPGHAGSAAELASATDPSGKVDSVKDASKAGAGAAATGHGQTEPVDKSAAKGDPADKQNTANVAAADAKPESDKAKVAA
ncbi:MULTISPECIES: hypothetical protein [Pseudomonas syringae group]|uniref:Type III helper protein HrpW1 n=2 Tax=Pseudomonas syringae group TaxID=136849 RepID=A0AB37QM51_9PSED|nr:MULTISPECIES: hypothetical protein [Pseudomonas syringae group]KPB52881.1 Type III helper protein HrpW1 [Pseudomonas coronafaciens pv. oryzae]KPX32751.1 Type III helper protein HrpW1 [Pseudomonas coronafaciens pv. garcae]KPY08793.1 Type III helper protein HrpW1 [Pseudomonas coronafaciens pv. oryzae]MCF5802538.1 hypothetical protein [Pseudomonas tremae]MCF5808507.1 hypothetical protein [Pseudomonas tremae]